MLWLTAWTGAARALPAEPVGLRLAARNAHYVEFRGNPTVLVTAGEHYGAVINPAFDYRSYLGELRAHGLNLTRLFSGSYVEGEESIGWMGARNTLAPGRGQLLAPWVRSGTAGYARGGNRFDLDRWDDQYFSRLRSFVEEAGRLGIVVEIVLFGNQYSDKTWRYSPMRESNNVNGVGVMSWKEFLSLRDASLVSRQEALVRRIVAELRDFDNIYYEVANEPWNNGVEPQEWVLRMIGVIVAAEGGPGPKHLIALQGLQDDRRRIADPRISIYNYHYTWGADWVGGIEGLDRDYGLKKVLALDETDGVDVHLTPAEARVEAWEFLIGGGGIYSNLCWEYVPGNPTGNTPAGRAVRRQLGILKRFMDGLNLLDMRPDPGVVKSGLEEGAHSRALVEDGQSYVVYIHHGLRSKKLDTSYRVIPGRHRAKPVLELPAGRYREEWMEPATGRVLAARSFGHPGGAAELSSPQYTEDIVLVVKRQRR